MIIINDCLKHNNAMYDGRASVYGEGEAAIIEIDFTDRRLAHTTVLLNREDLTAMLKLLENSAAAAKE